jgi:Ca2+/Na+ antiporter
MKEMFDELFKLYPPYAVAVGNDGVALFLNAVGSFIIGITFVIIGVICLLRAGEGEKSKKRKYLSQMFGIFILTCGLARFVDLLSLWYNYAIINGILKICTGLMACVTLGYVPRVIKELKDAASLQTVKDKLDITAEKIEELTKKTQERGTA